MLILMVLWQHYDSSGFVKVADNDGCMVACGIRTYTLSSYDNANRKQVL